MTMIPATVKFALGLVVICNAFAQQSPRIPRQADQTATAIQGIVRNPAGLGLGGAAVQFRTADGQEYRATTTGDGVFRILNVLPGSYELSVGMDGFQSFRRAGGPLRTGDTLNLEVVLQEIPAGKVGVREVPLRPELGQRQAPFEVEPVEPLGREIPVASNAQIVTEMAPPTLPAPYDRIFTGVRNRWADDYPAYSRYGQKGEYPYVVAHWYDPFNRNKLKGDYPIFGKRTFLNVKLFSETFADVRRIPTPSNVGSENPDSQNFFGGFKQFAMSETLAFSFDLFHGDAAFRPIDWRIKFTPEVNVNYLKVDERGIVNIDVRKGTTRTDAHIALQEAFVEVKLKDLGHEYDFVSARAGIQGFNSDFRGFIFSDQEPGLRIFGNFRSNRYQYNLAYFTMLEKDTNSGLNRLDYRNQQVWIANLYRQDFIKRGYTIQFSFHYNKDDPSLKFDENNFLVRPSPIGAVKQHSIRAYYYGLSGDGHLGKLNITHSFYQVLGHDKLNPLAGKRVDINAQMAAVELSLDKDWIRYRLSFFYASGDKDPRDGSARGFDAIFDHPNFAGGIFSLWNREGIRLTGTGVALVSGDSLLPSLRSSKIQGQGSFVNPGLFLYNAGADIDITPKLRGFLNFNVVRFARTEPLELLLFQKPIHAGLGADSGVGVKYRPPLSDNIILVAGFNTFQPFRGFRDIYVGRLLLSGFVSLRFTF